jgi:error-prone DNA polymerase
MTPLEETAADLWATGVHTGVHPLTLLRPFLEGRGVRTAASLVGGEEDEGRVAVAGAVTHRQRPSTAGGTVFVNLEDETGVLNVICSAGLWLRYRKEAASPALLVTGRLERSGSGGEAVNVVAERLERLEIPLVLARSRDFR